MLAYVLEFVSGMSVVINVFKSIGAFKLIFIYVFI